MAHSSPPAKTSIEEQRLSDESPIVTPISTNIERSTRILHVDDDPSLVEMVAIFLERNRDNFDVTTETHPSDVLNRLNDESFDCIVSDYDMPEMDGLDLLQSVRNIDPSLPFVLFTGKGSEEIASEAITRGVTEYMQKGGGTDQYEVLANRIQHAVSQHRTYEELQQALSWYQRLVEQELAGIYLVQDEELVYVNQRFADVFGYSQKELIGEHALKLVDETDRETVRESLQKREQGTLDESHYSWQGRHQDGSQLQIEVHGGTIEYQDKPAVIGMLLPIED